MHEAADEESEVVPVLPARAAAALAALLAIDAETAAGIRDRTPSRRRSTRQYGPQLDLGVPD